VNFITYLEPPYLLNYNYIVVPFPTGFFVSAYLNGEGVQEFFTDIITSPMDEVYTQMYISSFDRIIKCN
jgi:hypothetical protein